MSAGDALEPDMRRFALDPDTAERLVRGAMVPADAPPGYREVASLLQDAAAGARTAAPGTDKATTVAAVAEAVRSHPPASTRPRRSVLTKAKLAAAGLTGALVLTTGLAAANALPGAAQSVASDTLAKVGVSVPNPNSHSAGHADNRGKSADHNSSSSPDSTNATNSPNAHADFGLCNAAEAHHDNGAQPKSTVFPSATTCSTVAHPGQATQSDPGKPANPVSQGQANEPSSTPDGPPSSTPASGNAPVATPNDGGTSTANTASDGHSSAGTSTANTASDGHSSAGSDNAGSHRP